MRQIKEISHEKTSVWLRKGNLKKVIDFLLIRVQNKATRIFYIKAKIYNAHQNSKCSSRDETLNHIISKSSQQTENEYKTRHSWLGKVIQWELCKKLKSDHTTKWYIPKSESILENETYKIVKDLRYKRIT